MHKTTESSDDDSFVDSDISPAPDQTLSSELNSIKNTVWEVSGSVRNTDLVDPAKDDIMIVVELKKSKVENEQNVR
jgi:hypothetical protein